MNNKKALQKYIRHDILPTLRQEEKTVDLPSFLDSTEHWAVEEGERLRQLAIALEEEDENLSLPDMWDKLSSIYEEASRRDGENPLIYHSKAITALHTIQAAWMNENYHKLIPQLKKEALHAIQQAVSLEEDNANFYYTWGLILDFTKSESEATLQKFREALEKDPEFHMARLYLGDLLFHNGQWEAALAELERVGRKPLLEDWPLWRSVLLEELTYICYQKLDRERLAAETFGRLVHLYKNHEFDQTDEPIRLLDFLEETRQMERLEELIEVLEGDRE